MGIIHEFPISVGILKNWIDLLPNFLTMYIIMNLESSPTKATRVKLRLKFRMFIKVII